MPHTGEDLTNMAPLVGGNAWCVYVVCLPGGCLQSHAYYCGPSPQAAKADFVNSFEQTWDYWQSASPKCTCASSTRCIASIHT